MIAIYDQVLARFEDAPEPALRDKVALALFNKGVRLGELNRSEEAHQTLHKAWVWRQSLPNSGELLSHILKELASPPQQEWGEQGQDPSRLR